MYFRIFLKMRDVNLSFHLAQRGGKSKLDEHCVHFPIRVAQFGLLEFGAIFGSCIGRECEICYWYM